MKKNLLLRAVSLVMSALLLTSMSGCSDKKNSAEQTDGNITGVVYRGEEYNMSAELKSCKLSGYIYANDRIYCISKKTIPSAKASEAETTDYSLVSMKKDGTDYISVPLTSGTNIIVSQPTVDSNGNICYVETTGINDEKAIASSNTYMLKKLDKSGKLINSTDITSSVSEQLKDTQKTFIPQFTCCDKNDNIYVVGFFNTVVFDSNANYLFSIKTDYVDSAVTVADKTVCLYQYKDDGTRAFCPVDISTKALGDSINFFENQMDYYDYTPVHGSEKYDFYLLGTESLYGYDIETSQKTEILNWIDSNISISEITSIVYISDNEIICAGTSILSDSPIITILKTIDASSLPQKAEITLAGLSYTINNNIKNQIVQFNKKSDKYKIKLKTFNDGTGYTDLNNEIMAGKIPDILITNNYIPIDSYISKGLFADMYEFMDKDPEIKRSDFIENIISSFETDGKLYKFTDSFKIYSVIGKTSEVGDKTGWTYDDVIKYVDSKPKGTEILAGTTKSDVLTYGMELSPELFIDYDKRTCNFESDEFIKLLEFSNRFLDQVDYETYFDDDFWNKSKTMYKDGNVLLQLAYLRNYGDLYAFEKMNFSAPVTAKGFPCSSKNGNAVVADSGFSISAKSKNQDGAWEFVRSLLSDNYQQSTDCFPVKKSALEIKAAEAMVYDEKRAEQPLEYTIGNVGIAISGDIEIGEPKQADIDRVNELIKSLDKQMRCDDMVLNIITEEASAYFSGSKTPQEAAKLIQNRVQLYLNENS